MSTVVMVRYMSTRHTTESRPEIARSHSNKYSHIYVHMQYHPDSAEPSDPSDHLLNSAQPTPTPALHSNKPNERPKQARHTRPTQPAHLRLTRDLRYDARIAERGPGSRVQSIGPQMQGPNKETGEAGES
jgi:hypothetical protein